MLRAWQGDVVAVEVKLYSGDSWSPEGMRYSNNFGDSAALQGRRIYPKHRRKRCAEDMDREHWFNLVTGEKDRLEPTKDWIAGRRNHSEKSLGGSSATFMQLRWSRSLCVSVDLLGAGSYDFACGGKRGFPVGELHHFAGFARRPNHLPLPHRREAWERGDGPCLQGRGREARSLCCA